MLDLKCVQLILDSGKFYGNLVYRLKKIVGSDTFFSAVH